MDKITPWYPTIANMAIPIAAAIPSLMYLPASGGGAVSCLGLLYKTSIVVKFVN